MQLATKALDLFVTQNDAERLAIPHTKGNGTRVNRQPTSWSFAFVLGGTPSWRDRHRRSGVSGSAVLSGASWRLRILDFFPALQCLR